MSAQTGSAPTSTCSRVCRRCSGTSDGYLCTRRLLSGITDLEIRPGTVGLICTIIGTTTFDGFSNGGVWRRTSRACRASFSDLGFNQTPAIELAYSLGLLFCIVPDRGGLSARDHRGAQREHALSTPSS